MFCAVFLALYSSVAIASPFFFGSDDWDSWFSSPSNAADIQPLSDLNTLSFENDMPYWSDLDSYQVESDGNMFASADETLVSEQSDPGATVAYSGSWADDWPASEALVFGPQPQAKTDFETWTGQDLLAQFATPPTPEKYMDSDMTTPQDPCEIIETYCCTKIQYAPLLYVDKKYCKPCMTHADGFRFIYLLPVCH